MTVKRMEDAMWPSHPEEPSPSRSEPEDTMDAALLVATAMGGSRKLGGRFHGDGAGPWPLGRADTGAAVTGLPLGAETVLRGEGGTAVPAGVETVLRGDGGTAVGPVLLGEAVPVPAKASADLSEDTAAVDPCARDAQGLLWEHSTSHRRGR